MSSRPLSPPSVERKNFNINHLDMVVAQLNFPTYLSLEKEDSEEIANLSKIWRSKFPKYTKTYNTNISPHGASKAVPTHEFIDKFNKWNIALTSYNITISTRKYENFEALLEVIKFVSDSALPLIETDFYTRIGLRYVNKILVDNSQTDLDKSINEQLAGLSGAGVFGSVRNLRTEVQGKLTDKGSYVFRYGISHDSVNSTEDVGKNAIILDFDYMEENVEANEALDLYQHFHDRHFPFFWWTLGEKTKRELEDA